MNSKHIGLLALVLGSLACGNTKNNPPAATGGSSSSSGGTNENGGNESSSGGESESGGNSDSSASKSTGGKGGTSSTKSASSSKNTSTATGGKSGTATARGGATSAGGATAVGGENSGGGDPAGGTSATGPAGYALPPPSECSNQFSVQGCVKGDANSTCKGVCSNDYGATSKNACESGKDGVPVQYACVRHMLFSTEMTQAAIDDGYEGKFNYAVVGHDPDPTNLDKGLSDSCCQCYQLVFDAPRYLTNSTLTPPMPLIVQSFNTQASGPTGFDVYMGAGGLGAFNACNDALPYGSKFGYSLYKTYPDEGQGFSGGVKPGPDSLKCSDANNNLSDALIAAESCQNKVQTACNEITADAKAVQDDTRKSCIQSNQATSYYHENWKVYAKRVTCPTHLTEVTGCKLAAQSGLAAPEPDVQTVAQAKTKGFSNTLNNEQYHTTTMQDCCMPTCAWKNNVRSATVDGYSSFYSCRADGTPITQAE
ncbi:MAG TPA: hypothetical protein VKP30_23330 [Polyangiaceae bacterium]|nr:hypothetical protein [Polyangiaceae bacterium]